METKSRHCLPFKDICLETQIFIEKEIVQRWQITLLILSRWILLNVAWIRNNSKEWKRKKRIEIKERMSGRFVGGQKFTLKGNVIRQN